MLHQHPVRERNTTSRRIQSLGVDSEADTAKSPLCSVCDLSRVLAGDLGDGELLADSMQVFHVAQVHAISVLPSVADRQDEVGGLGLVLEYRGTIETVLDRRNSFSAVDVTEI